MSEAYDYLLREVRERLPELYATEEIVPVVQVKYFLPEGRWTFYAIEYSQVAPDGAPDLFYGWLKSPLGSRFDLLCYLSLETMKGLRSSLFGLPVERDLQFIPCPLSQIRGVLDKA